MKELYKEVLEKHGAVISEIEEAVILHHIDKITNYTKSHLERLEECLDYWCQVYEVTKSEVRSRSRKRELAEVRSIVTWIIRNEMLGFRWTYKSIGKVFNRDHTTAIHSMKVVDGLIKYDGFIRDMVMKYLDQIGYITEWNRDERTLKWSKQIDLSGENAELTENAVLLPSEELSPVDGATA